VTANPVLRVLGPFMDLVYSLPRDQRGETYRDAEGE
jgi:hypothetical protein